MIKLLIGLIFYLILAINISPQTLLTEYVVNYSYDQLNRVQIIEYPNGTTITYTYDALGNRLTKTIQSQSIELEVKVIPEGLYNTGTNRLNISDTVKIYLRNVGSPYSIVDSALSVIDSLLFTCHFSFLNVDNGAYYLVFKHRNSVETWSKEGGESLVKGSTANYDFTDSSSSAYGNNMKLINNAWCIYSGDVNQDGIVDITDLVLVDNDNYNFVTGYTKTDVNGDGIVDVTDLVIVDYNSLNYVSKITPSTIILKKEIQDNKGTEESKSSIKNNY